ncbi:MAG TPA: hypothetical protein VGS12_14540 [Caulobacteraceae bacterium]|nr:hypothetical protein [Caulobacteraceae bacterium]
MGGLAIPIPLAAVAAAADPVMSLYALRQAVARRLDEIDAEDEAGIGRLCDAQDDLAARMARLPIRSRAAAHAKLAVATETFEGDRDRATWDRDMVTQVLAWLRAG